MKHVKILKGQPRRFALWELVPNWYKKLSRDHTDLVEIKSQLGWVIKPRLCGPHNLVQRIRSWRIKSLEQDFEYLYWKISNILFWNLFTSKWTEFIDWFGRITLNEDSCLESLEWFVESSFRVICVENPGLFPQHEPLVGTPIGKTGVTADRDKIEFRLFNSSHLNQVPWREVEGHYSPPIRARRIKWCERTCVCIELHGVSPRVQSYIISQCDYIIKTFSLYPHKQSLSTLNSVQRSKAVSWVRQNIHGRIHS